MISFVAFSVAISIAIGIAVLWANPYRLTNQAFAVTFLLVAGWLACVLVALKAKAEGGDAAPWHRANTAVASFIPWAIWLLKESIVARGSRSWRVLQKSLPWLTLGALLAGLCYTGSFVERKADGALQRGSSYVIWELVAIMAYLVLTVNSIRQMRGETGIRRVEIQFWTMNFGLQGVIITTLMAIGNLAGIPILKDIAIITTFGMFVTTAWATTAHRVFDVRQVFLAIAHRITLIAILGIGMFGIAQGLGHFLTAPIGLVLALAACSSSMLWLERRSRKWFHIDDEQILTEMRMTVIGFERTEPSPEQLIDRFQQMLTRHSNTDTASLLFDSSGAFVSDRFYIAKDSPAYTALTKLGWATPERLQRQRATRELAALQEYSAEHSIALIITVPQHSPSPSLLVALGTKTNEWPFTYPEVRRIQGIAELMDNILTRSRLTTQVALKAKTEHLAMMSRGLAHDLKNLLTPVSSFLVHTEGRFPAESVEAEVHGAAQRSIRIMGEYVREARFFAEQLTPRFEPVALADLFKSVREITGPRATARSVSLATIISGDGNVIVDRVLIQRLLGNLVANAIDASSAGQSVELRAEVRDGRLRLQVKDDGCGIAPEHLGRVFEAYFTTKEFGDDVRGFGLGLTICQKIVALHNGEISVQSELGKGSTFAVEMPASPIAAVLDDASFRMMSGT